MMRKYRTIGFVCGVGVLGMSACAAGKPSAAPPNGAAAQYSTGGAQVYGGVPAYDSWLSQYAYPYPVSVFEPWVQGRQLVMAYMDVQPQLPNGQTVVLMHGKNFSGAYWSRTAQALSTQGYRVIIPDQIGFGKSAKPIDIQYSFHQLAHTTRELLEHLGVSRVTVVGHSMGGMLAARFALMFPALTRQLVLVNPLGLEDYRSQLPYRPIEERAQQELAATPESIRQYMAHNYFDGQWKPEYEELVSIQAGWAVGPDRQYLARVSALTYDMIYTQPVVRQFPEVRVPTLLVIGQRDRTALDKSLVAEDVAQSLGDYPRLGKLAAEARPEAELVEFEAVGHVPQYEAFEAWMQALSTFLAKP